MPVETALMTINSQNGVEVGTEIQKRYVEKYNMPLILAMNHLDHDKSNFEKSFETVKQSFGSNAVLAQYPVNQGSGFVIVSL